MRCPNLGGKIPFFDTLFVSSPVCLSPVAGVQAAAALPSLAKGQGSDGGGTPRGRLPGATGVSYLAPCGLPRPGHTCHQYEQLGAQIPSGQ